MNRILGRSGPFALFHHYPALLRLGLVSTCAETTWATLLIAMEYYFKDELLVGESSQYIASKVALMFLAFTGAETLLKYPMGALADKYGPRRFVLGALLACSISPILMTVFGYFFKSYWPFLPLRAVDGIAAAALWPAMSALMSRAVPRDAKATAMSVFNGAYVLGLAVGPAAGLLLGHVLGTNLYVFPFTAGLMMIGLVIALQSIPVENVSPQSNARTQTATGAESAVTLEPVLPEGTSKEHKELAGESLSEETAVLRGRPMLVRMMALYALSQVGIGILAPTLPFYIDDQFGIKQGDLPRLLPIPALLVLAIAIPLGRLPDKVGQAKSVWISYAMAAIGMLMIAGTSLFTPDKRPISPSLLMFAGGVGLMIISYILGTPAWLGLTSLQVDETKQARALSLMQTAQGVGVVFAYILVSSAGHLLTTVEKVKSKINHTDVAAVVERTKDSVPLSMWFWVASAIFVVCLIGTLLYVKEEKQHDDDEASAKVPIELKGL